MLGRYLKVRRLILLDQYSLKEQSVVIAKGRTQMYSSIDRYSLTEVIVAEIL